MRRSSDSLVLDAQASVGYGPWDILKNDPSWRSGNNEKNDYCCVRFRSNDPLDSIRLLNYLRRRNDLLVEFLTGEGILANQFRRLAIEVLGANINEAFKRLVEADLKEKNVTIVGHCFSIRSMDDKLFFILEDGSPENVRRVVHLKVNTGAHEYDIVHPSRSVPTHPFHCVIRNLKNFVSSKDLEQHCVSTAASSGLGGRLVFCLMETGGDNWSYAFDSWEVTEYVLKNWDFIPEHIAFDADRPVLVYDENMDYTEAALARKRNYRRLGRPASSLDIGSTALVSKLLSQMETARAASEAAAADQGREMARMGELILITQRDQQIAQQRFEEAQRASNRDIVRIGKTITNVQDSMAARFEEIALRSEEISRVQLSFAAKAELDRQYQQQHNLLSSEETHLNHQLARLEDTERRYQETVNMSRGCSWVDVC